jgi:acetate kinase
MAASLGGVDQIALSGGIGAHDGLLLEELRGSMAWLGAITWRQITADEEGMIARLIQRLI